MDNKEKRFSNEIEVRKLDDGTEVIEGYAIVFDSTSQNLGGFTETINRRALDNTDMSDTVALFNHDNNVVLGRSPKTLQLTVDERGLKYTIEPPNTTAAKDLAISIERGDIRGSSFGFMIAKDGDTWIEPEQRGGMWKREVTNISRLIDVSPVTSPAYESSDTSVAKRSLGKIKDDSEAKDNALIEKQKAEKEAEERKLKLQEQNFEFLSIKHKYK